MTRAAGFDHWELPSREWLYVSGTRPGSRGPSEKLPAEWDVPDYGHIPWEPYPAPTGKLVWAHSLGRSPPDRLSHVWDAMMKVADAQAAQRERAQEMRREGQRRRYQEQREKITSYDALVEQMEYDEFRTETLRRYGFAK
jgi:hypothetical protein